ncbi:hypothetical protein FGO68_gene10716 [Halteria grandinella]|uniref:Uncharacterized protein n=1 Tax=Halteria grandinella TaxID=5974 RepID=A0A8J8TAC0_HALGN|nr:hypothetical protein FGO68_gene10716 [Halteria grandinella]
MYLYPVSDAIYEDDFQSYHFEDYTSCVADCNEYDLNFVNNPELMRCEFLGVFCLYGNYTHGCLKPMTTSTTDSNIKFIANFFQMNGFYFHLQSIQLTLNKNSGIKIGLKLQLRNIRILKFLEEQTMLHFLGSLQSLSHDHLCERLRGPNQVLLLMPLRLHLRSSFLYLHQVMPPWILSRALHTHRQVPDC